MRSMSKIRALASDYDGTLAHDGVVSVETVVALERYKTASRGLLMVTGRQLDELKSVCNCLDLFDMIVAENGALLYEPKSGQETLLTTAPSRALVERLKGEKVPGLSVGRSIIATWVPYETIVLEAIRDLGLELQIILNKGAVMILPSGVNKATGLKAALEKMDLKSEQVAGIGDAENDHSFISACGCKVAVANAIASLKREADIVTRADRGAGVVELIDFLLREPQPDQYARAETGT
jgi:HAD superfamily hydrolase (TIGR01484 family)